MTAPVGDDTDRDGQERQRSFAGRVEQAFGRETPTALLHHGHQGADARGLQRFDDDLVGGFARERGELSGRHHFHALFGLDPHAREAGAPDHGVDAGAFVLQGEIGVAGGMRPTVVRYLAPHPDVAETVLDRALQRARKLADGDFGRVTEPAGFAREGSRPGLAACRCRVEDRGCLGSRLRARPALGSRRHRGRL